MFKVNVPKSPQELASYLVEDNESFYGTTGWYIDPPKRGRDFFQFLLTEHVRGTDYYLRKNSGVILKHKNEMVGHSAERMFTELTIVTHRLIRGRALHKIEGVTGPEEWQAAGGHEPLQIAASGVFAYLQGQINTELARPPHRDSVSAQL